MAFSYDINEVPTTDVPCLDHEIRRAKMYLQTHSTESGDSLYDHLSELLQKILAERPRNAVDSFEEYSRKLKEERFKTCSEYLRDVYVPPLQYEEAKKFIQLIQDTRETHVDEERIMAEQEDEEINIKTPNLLDLVYYFEQAGVAIPRMEAIALNLAIWKLVKTRPIENVRFWGKILGTSKNYYVIEAELREEELNRRWEQQEMDEKVEKEIGEMEYTDEAIKETSEVSVEGEEEFKGEVEETPIKVAENEDRVGCDLSPLPADACETPPVVPPEKIGTGLNKKVYFVSNTPGLDEWIELPPVTPQQIVTSRQIIRYFTGNLDNPLPTYPPFPGTERNYLRAQIARISAATHISPVGFYTLSGEIEEEEVEDEIRENNGLSENPHYDPLPIKYLVDPSMSHWCHHSPYILNQGRAIWWASQKSVESVAEESEDEEEAEEEEEDHATDDINIEKEDGPPLLTPLSEDSVIDSIIPWTARQSSSILPHNSIAVIRSNIWPGAFAFASGRRFGNVYIGWGRRNYAQHYSPPALPPAQDQYKFQPEIAEMFLPTAAEEEA